jgi:hypothetical protein
MLVYPRSGWVILCNAWCPPVGLPNVSQASLEPASGGMRALLFLSVTWHGEALYRLRAQSVKGFILFGALFLPSVAPASQQDF